MTRTGALAAVAVLLALAARPGLGGGSERDGSGWLLGGIHVDDYAVELEPSGGRLGTAAALLRSVAAEPEGFVSIMRWVDASPHHNARLRLTAWLQTEDVAGWSGLWMRLDDLDAEGRAETVAFDNMQGRPVRGTTDWRKYQVVLDVPEEADRLYYGFLLAREGRVRADQFELEEVDPDELGVTASPPLPPGPHNLDFDHPPDGSDRLPDEGAGPPP